jgi:23S rRNA pseudouridine2605 synthase
LIALYDHKKCASKLPVKKTHKKKVRRPKWPKPAPEREQTAPRPKTGGRPSMSSRGRAEHGAQGPSHPRDDRRRQTGGRAQTGQRPEDLRETLKRLEKGRTSRGSLETRADQRPPGGEARAPQPLKANVTANTHSRSVERPQKSERPQKARRSQAGPRPPATEHANQRKLKTLDRVISKAGLGSRAEARSWIGSGRVAVNGKKIQTPDHWVDVAADRVTVDGRPLGAARKVYLLLYKPKGYLTTYKDPEGRRTVYNLIPGIDQFISPVGRLDLDTSGLLIMTNDTDFGNHIMSPESKVAKTYLVKSSLLLSDDQLDRLRAGLDLDDGPTRPATVTRTRDSTRYTFFEITITEGRNRQVRRMVEALGAKVLKLVRVAIGATRIGDLEFGTYRYLTPPEINQLYGRGHADAAVGKAERKNAKIDSSSRSS